MAKHRGLSRAVQAVLWGVALTAVAGCASSWHHTRKNGAEAAADERACSSQAEENVLARAGRQRADYRLDRALPPPSMNRGETPMQLVDRRATQDDYGRDFENCMTARGYERR